jgi:uncharacterized protein (TIGR02117 family)
VRRRVWLAIAVVPALIVTYLLAAVLGAILPGQVAHQPDEAATAQIVLIAGPIHYDILLPADAATRAAFAFATRDGVPVNEPRVAWIAVGWGSRAFYTATGAYTDLRPAILWRAITGDTAVIRIDVAGALPLDPRLRQVSVTPTQLAALRSAVLADLSSRSALDLSGFNETDAFYPAHGAFDIFRTCSTWVGHVLRQSGLAMGAWTPTPYAVTLSLWWNGHLG